MGASPRARARHDHVRRVAARRGGATEARENLRSYLADGFLTKPAYSFSLLQGLWAIAGAGGTYELFARSSASRTASSAARSSSRCAWPSGSASVSCSRRRSRAIRWSGERRRGRRRRRSRRARAPRSSPSRRTSGRDPLRACAPAWRMRLQQASSQGSVTKFLAVYAEPFWRGGALGRGLRAAPVRPRALRQHAALGVGRRPLHVPPRASRRTRSGAASADAATRAARSSRGWRSSSARARSTRPTTSRRTGRPRSGRAARMRRRSASAGSPASAPTCAARSARSTGRAPTSPDSGTCTWRVRALGRGCGRPLFWPLTRSRTSASSAREVSCRATRRRARELARRPGPPRQSSTTRPRSATATIVITSVSVASAFSAGVGAVRPVA